MSQPDPIGAIGQLLLGSKDNPADHLGWHTFEIKDTPRPSEVGAWCVANISGAWTFKTEYKRMTFYFQDGQDAMFFKLAWVV